MSVRRTKFPFKWRAWLACAFAIGAVATAGANVGPAANSMSELPLRAELMQSTLSGQSRELSGQDLGAWLDGYMPNALVLLLSFTVLLWVAVAFKLISFNVQY